MRYFQSPPMKIGKHIWRISVDDSPCHSRVTVYEFLRISPYDIDMHDGKWQNETRWPSYNGDDTYGGIPKTLAKLYKLYETKIKELLEGK